MRWSLPQQAFAIRDRFPDSTIKLTPKLLDCGCVLQPNTVSRSYRVRIAYTGRAYPKVRVTAPKLDSRPGESLPHVFNDGSLCLHEDDDWTPSMLIADTIVPWASEWLIHYEIWLFNGTWYGGGEWPPKRDTDMTTDPEVILPDIPGGALEARLESVMAQDQPQRRHD